MPVFLTVEHTEKVFNRGRDGFASRVVSLSIDVDPAFFVVGQPVPFEIDAVAIVNEVATSIWTGTRVRAVAGSARDIDEIEAWSKDSNSRKVVWLKTTGNFQ